MALVYGLYYGLQARPLRHPVDLRGAVRLLLPRRSCCGRRSTRSSPRATRAGEPALPRSRSRSDLGRQRPQRARSRSSCCPCLSCRCTSRSRRSAARLRRRSLTALRSTPPELEPSAAQAARWRALPAIRDAVPVLAYHGVNGVRDHYSVTRRQFAEQMMMLDRAGFETITIARVRALPPGSHGQPAEAPDPDHVRRRAAGFVSRRRPDPGRARVPRDDVHDRRFRGGAQLLLPDLGRARARWRPACDGTSRSTPGWAT